MATAPMPMPESRADQAARRDAQATIFAFAVGEHVYRIAPFNVPIGEKLAVQRDTGVAWEEVIRPLLEGHVSQASVAVIAWLARRASGEPRLDWRTFSAEWDDESVGDEITLSIEAGDGDDPEA